jgi:hypothetical protein
MKAVEGLSKFTHLGMTIINTGCSQEDTEKNKFKDFLG